MHFGAQVFQALLVAHAEAVLLVHHHQAQILEAHIVLQQAMGADDDVDLAVAQVFQQGGLLLGGAHARQAGDAQRPVGEAVAEVLLVLLHQQGGRRQHANLLAGARGGEAGAQRHLGLAEADITADHAVHRLGAGQIGQHGVDGLLLVDGGLEREAFAEQGVVGFIHHHRRAGLGGAAGLHLQQLGGDVGGALLGPGPGLGPALGAEAVQRRRFAFRAGIAVNKIERGDRHIELVAVRIAQHQILGFDAARIKLLQAQVTAHAMLDVHHRRAGLEVVEIAQDGFGIANLAALAHRGRRALAEHLGLGDQGDAGGGDAEAVLQGAQRDAVAVAVGDEGWPAVMHPAEQAQGLEPVEQGFAAAGGFGHEQHPVGAGREEAAHRFGAGGQHLDAGIRFEADADRGIACKILLRPRRLQEQVGRFHQRPFQVAGVALVAFLDLLPLGAQRRRNIVDLDQQTVAGQIVEHRCGAAAAFVEEQRQIGLDATRHQRLADFGIDARARRVAGEVFAVAAAEGVDAFLVGGEFARRQQADLGHLFGGALGLRIELADALHLVVEQVEAIGLGRAHRKHVDQRAAHGELALGLHFRHALIAGGDQAFAEGMRRQLVAGLEQQHAAVEPGARRQALQQGAGGDNQHATCKFGQAVQRGEAIGKDFLVRRVRVVGKCLGIRKVRHRLLAA